MPSRYTIRELKFVVVRKIGRSATAIRQQRCLRGVSCVVKPNKKGIWSKQETKKLNDIVKLVKNFADETGKSPKTIAYKIFRTFQ